MHVTTHAGYGGPPLRPHRGEALGVETPVRAALG